MGFPAHGLTPVAALILPYTHTCRTESPSPIKPSKKVRKEFNKKIGQVALIRHRAWPDKCTDQTTLLHVTFLLPSICPFVFLSQIT